MSINLSPVMVEREDFVQKLHNESEDACIVGAIVSTAQGLKMNIVAEGVEHMFQFNYLRSLGCNIVQGYLFGEATSLADVVVRYPYGKRQVKNESVFNKEAGSD